MFVFAKPGALARTMACARVRLVRCSWLCTKTSTRWPATSGGTRNTVTTAPSATASGLGGRTAEPRTRVISGDSML